MKLLLTCFFLPKYICSRKSSPSIKYQFNNSRHFTINCIKKHVEIYSLIRGNITIYKNCQQYLLTYMGKSILKLPNFDMKMTKFGYSLQVLLPLCQYISKLICTYKSIHGVLSVFLSTVSIYFSLY